MKTGIETPNQISIWLVTEKGHQHFLDLGFSEKYFDHFKTFNDMGAADEMIDGLNYLKTKIEGGTTDERYSFAIVKKVTGGKAGACYLYPELNLQNDRDIPDLESFILQAVKNWGILVKVTVNKPIYNTSDGWKYMVITVSL